MSVQIRSVNGKTSMLDRAVAVLSRQILSDILHNESSKGVITFSNYDYEVTIKRVSKMRTFYKNLFKKLAHTKPKA